MKPETVDPLAKKRQLAGALMSERGLMRHKYDVLSPYGVERIRDLDARQLNELIDSLMKIQKERPRKEIDPELRSARSVVLSLLDDLGVKPKNGNWAAVNDYLRNPRIAGKVLYEMNLQEIKKCAQKLQMVKRWKAEKLEEDDRLARDN